jgi:OOP family OmpA-OmpF porin
VKTSLFLAALFLGCARKPEPVAVVPPVEPTEQPAPAESPTAKRFEMDGSRLLTGPVAFKTGSTELLPTSTAVLDHVADYLEAKPDVTKLRIEVHTDSVGASAANQALSEGRALAIARWLVKERHVDCTRLVATGFGSTKPIADNMTAEGRALNRRTEFVVAALRGKAIGGMPVEGGGKVSGDACAG